MLERGYTRSPVNTDRGLARAVAKAGGRDVIRITWRSSRTHWRTGGNGTRLIVPVMLRPGD